MAVTARGAPGKRVRRSARVPARRVGAVGVGAVAIGALVLGAAAIGALALGRLAIGRMAVGKARFRDVEIDKLTVRRLRVLDAVGTASCAAGATRRRSTAGSR